MRLAVDAQLAVGTATGIGEYVNGLIGALRSRGMDVAALQEPRIDPWRFDRRVLWDQVLLPAAALRSRADLLHCASGTMPLFTKIPVVVTVHDVAWFRTQAHARPYARYYFGAFSLKRYKRARRVVVDSEFSRSELLQFFDAPASRVSVVYPGVADDYCRLQRKPDERRFILAVGTVEPRKNLAVVVRALRDLPEDVKLIAVGPPTPYQTLCRDLAVRAGVSDRIEWRGYVTREVLLDLFARASAVVVPSKYEGFGYCAAQSLCAAVPLLVASASSLPEIVQGDAPALDPDDEHAWSAHLNRILCEPAAAQQRADAIRHGAVTRFAWRASIARLVSVYGAALS